MHEKVMLVKGDPRDLPSGWKLYETKEIADTISDVCIRRKDRVGQADALAVIVKIDREGRTVRVDAGKTLEMEDPELLANVVAVFEAIEERLADGTLDVR